jgi:hypothetical protein
MLHREATRDVSDEVLRLQRELERVDELRSIGGEWNEDQHGQDHEDCGYRLPLAISWCHLHHDPHDGEAVSWQFWESDKENWLFTAVYVFPRSISS